MHTPFDFLDLGSPHSVGMALMRLVRNGALRRLARGLYDVPRPVKVGSLTIQLKHRPPRQVRSASPMSNLVFAALRSVGKANVNEARVAHLRETLSAKDRATLLKDLPLAPAWMHPHLRAYDDLRADVVALEITRTTLPLRATMRRWHRCFSMRRSRSMSYCSAFRLRSNSSTMGACFVPNPSNPHTVGV